MRRSINDQLGFADRYTSNERVITFNTYPVQNDNALGKYIGISFLDYINQSFNYRIRLRKETYDKYKDILPKTYHRFDNIPIPFKIVRFDIDDPHKAILVSIFGHVLVTTTDIIDQIGYYNQYYCNNMKDYIENLGKEMYIPNNMIYEDDFFDNFAKEKIHIFPIQSDIIYGQRVWIEFDKDLDDIPFGMENYPVPGNKFEFTDEMAREVVERDASLKNVDRNLLESYPVYYNVHSKSFIDNPKRSMLIGYVIRADIDSPDGQVVVVCKDQDIIKYFCLDEAKFFYDTDDNRKIDVRIPSSYSTIKDYNSVYDYIESL